MNFETEQVQQIRERRDGAARVIREKGQAFASSPSWKDIDYLLSLYDSQAEQGDLRDRDSVLAFFGASITEDGLLHIDMKKYHAAHLCQEHSFQPWRRNEIEEKCVMCIAREADNAATRMRDRCVAKMRRKAEGYQKDSERPDFLPGYKKQMAFAASALRESADDLQSLTLEQGEQEQSK